MLGVNPFCLRHVFSLTNLIAGVNLFSDIVAFLFLGPFGPFDPVIVAIATLIALIPNGFSRSKVMFNAGSGAVLSISGGIGLYGFVVVLLPAHFLNLLQKSEWIGCHLSSPCLPSPHCCLLKTPLHQIFCPVLLVHLETPLGSNVLFLLVNLPEYHLLPTVSLPVPCLIPSLPLFLCHLLRVAAPQATVDFEK